MKNYDVDIEGAVIVIRKTSRGRLSEGLNRVRETFPWAASAFALLLGIEYVGRGMPEGQWPFYIVTILILAGMIGVAFGLSRGLRRDVWAIDLGERVLAFESSMPWGGLRTAGVDLDEVTGLRLDTSGRALLVELGDDVETLAESHDVGDVREVAEALDRFLATKRAKLRVDNLG